MSVDHARKFLLTARVDAKLRDALNGAEDEAARTAILAEYGWHFTSEEMFEGYTNLFAKCIREDEANDIRNIHAWWQMLCQM